ncbi:uncharacterized protein [Lepeophtheirus salmonis]|uniref:uncharacterized protein n=1 Tax=Lepeophtheirus salmonis TaxID=72036 RepID=UPI001AE48FA7|nr:uncharacterized protein ZK643.6-like isoform X2 [Lepeophtheirus salmonis]
MSTLYLTLLFLLCCAFNAMGLISEFECRDSSNNCPLLVSTTSDACLLPRYQWMCPEQCGVCQASCRDTGASCFEQSEFCLQKSMQKQCPKSCASCDECEDLINSDLCSGYTHRCEEDTSVQYACRKTCELCDDSCNDASVHESLCYKFENNEYCTKNLTMDFMKRACRLTCGFCEPEVC